MSATKKLLCIAKQIIDEIDDSIYSMRCSLLRHTVLAYKVVLHSMSTPIWLKFVRYIFFFPALQSRQVNLKNPYKQYS